MIDTDDGRPNSGAPTSDEVLVAADRIVEAFRATDTARYFAGFSKDATFIFHPEAHRLQSRAEYEALWATWLGSNWRVTSCESTDRLVQAFPGGAVFSHTVHTAVDSDDGPDAYIERETIVFQAKGDGQLIAIHEHLSTTPTPELAADVTEATS